MTLLVGYVGGESVPLIRGVIVVKEIRIGLTFIIILIAKKKNLQNVG